MKPGELLTRLNHAQRTPRFKLIASIVLVVALAGLLGLLTLLAGDPEVGAGLQERAQERAQLRALAGEAASEGPVQLAERATDAALVMLAGEGDQKISPRGFATLGIAFTAVAAAGLFLIQLGVGLTFFAVLVIGWACASLLMLIPALASTGKLIFGAVPLVLLFLTGIELLRALFSWPHPIASIARNVVNEAIRMKISVVFIVLLILLLAVVPNSLDSAQPLRYRVQQWLQYGVGLSYAIMALLTLFLAVGSLTTEQRDRVIWQTMSKPTAPWHYMLGKWIGIMGINAVLLSVTAGGVYMFTEYLRRLPADGEVVYRVPLDSRVRETEDRRILESQVLVARVGEQAQPFRPTPEKTALFVDRIVEQRKQVNDSFEGTAVERAEIAQEIRDGYEEQVNDLVERRFDDMKQRDPRVTRAQANMAKLRQQVVDELELRYRTISPAEARRYLFLGLGDAEIHGDEMALIYTINSGSNDPSAMYSLTLLINGNPWPITDGDGRMFPEERWGLRQVSLGNAQTLSIPLNYISPFTNEPVDFVDPETGVMELAVINGHRARPLNPRPITFPPDGLEVLYPVGSYAMNFVRIMLVIWIKLGFVASVALMAGTFLSFPVACLVGLVVLWASESAVFLADSLGRFSLYDKDGNFQIMGLFVQSIAGPIAWTFRTYAELRPTANLVDGRLVGWGALFKSLGVIGSWTIAMLGLGWLVFRNRELALYSGK